ncbi:hypothetical protein B0H63DRAFT_488899 [Podospora didyma]|uniref:NAD(P)-binding domain-containing protein n=1 Tax=Podospora didyma TaxID=330526 RepID=A0AAE0K317_9PEZI|nr:hypothetical protein B0H63DRAFT_488899 [Podospora didyma]
MGLKVVLGGSTGFIGKEILRQCIQHPDITSIVALTRRQLPAPVDPKVSVVIPDDWLNYSPAVLQAIEGADACIWAIGKGPQKITTEEEANEIKKFCNDYTLAAAKALTPAPDSSGKKFRFVYLSGMSAERDQDKALWFMQEFRRIRLNSTFSRTPKRTQRCSSRTSSGRGSCWGRRRASRTWCAG